MYIIIGQGAAGTSAAKALRRLDPSTPVTIITDEPDSFYSRIDLPDIIAGKVDAADSELQSAEAFAAAGIECRHGQRVIAIHPQEKAVELDGGERLSYRKLLLATGSLSVVPPLPGSQAKGVHVLWTLGQTREIMQAASSTSAAVVIGAGLIGLKTALGLKARGLKVTVVEKLPRVMPRQLDERAAGIVTASLADKGVDVLVGREARAILTRDGAVSGVQLDDRELVCGMVVVAVGVKPNAELAKAAGLKVNRGIVVDRRQQTSSPDIFAAGDVAEVLDPLTGEPVVPAIWPVAVEQGEVAAVNMTGGQAEFEGGVASNAVEVAGVPMISVGDIEGQPGDEVLISGTGSKYRKLVLRGNVARGVLCLGDIRQAGVIAGQVLRKTELSDPSQLMSPMFSFATLVED